MRNGGTINVNIEIAIENDVDFDVNVDGAPESVAAAYVAFDSLQAYYVRKGANKKPEQ